MEPSEVWQKGWRPENRDPVWQWANRELTLRESPYGKRFVVDETPWLKAPLDVFPDNRVREIILQCCAQGGKSVSMAVAAAWALANQPAPTMVVAQTDEAARRFSRQRLLPMIESCSDLRATMPADRHEKTLKEILFANATLLVGGANESFLRAHSIRWLFCDEISDWKAGLIEQARARTTRYWNRRHWLASTPLDTDSDLDRAFKSGDMMEWNLRCPHCSKLFEPIFKDVVIWDTNDTTKPNGEWNFGEMRKTVRMVCPSCEKDIPNTDANFRKLNRGEYVVNNPNAPPHVASFRFNALCLPPAMISWGDLAEQFLRAKREESRGYLIPLKEFVTLRLAESWDESVANAPKAIELSEYDNDWADETVRFLTVDCQHLLADFWAVVRSWAKDGRSRLLAFRRLSSFDEVEALREEFGVKPHLTFVDIGYERFRVLSACRIHGWTGMRGDEQTDFLHSVKGRKFRRPFSQMVRDDPRDGSGKAVPTFRWSNPTIKDMLHNMRLGRGTEWKVSDTGEQHGQYVFQMDSERKKQETDRLGRPRLRWVRFRENHAWDCECMSIAAACLANILANPEGDSIPDGAD